MPGNTSEKWLLNNTIGNTVTSEDVEIVAKRYKLDKFVRVLDYHIDEYSEDKLGFLGIYMSLKITLKGSNQNHPETVSFFVKLVPRDCKELATVLSGGLFFKESNLFSTIIPQLEQNCETEQWYPTCYLAKENVIIMEDLRLKGYKLYNNIFDDLIVLKSVLASLARFHSCTIVMEAHLCRQLKKSVPLNEYYQGAFDETTFVRTGPVARWFSTCYELTCALAKNLGYDSDKIRKAYDQMYHMVQPSKTHRNVICHGDLWSNNLMFADGSPLQKCILIDYQLIRYAPLVTDLLQVMHLNVTRAFRHKYEKALIQFYHSILQETLKSNNLTDKIKVPTLTEIFKGMDDLRIFGLVVATVTLPMVLIDSKTAAACTKDSESHENFVFGDRFAATVAYMKENEFYKSIVEEAIIELVEESELLYK